MFEFQVKTTMQATVNITPLSQEDDVWYYKITVENPNKEPIRQVALATAYPATGAFSTWSSRLCFDRGLRPVWRPAKCESRICSSAPVQQVIAAGGNNIVCASLLDAATPIQITTGMSEENSEIVVTINLFVMPVTMFTHYETVLRLDTRAVPYYDVLNDVKTWWREVGGYQEAFVPDLATRPVNSAWYSYHQDILVDEIVEECRRSKKLGMESIIIDDGWQTDNIQRGYAYCGDWEVAASKIPDMAQFVKRVHETGLKFMLWYSVPFVGIKSNAFQTFRDKLLGIADNLKSGILDPRYKEVRDYLTAKYEAAVRDWDLDGLKLDFIDSFTLLNENEAYDPERDFESVEQATAHLLQEIHEKLTAIKPDICIEFRQSYIGPIAAACGNMLRAGDCPADPLTNRVRCIDLRLLAGRTAVHSDMIMWDLRDTAENAANQFIAILFSVPQISMKLFELPQSHRAMLQFYLSLWLENRDILLKGKLKPMEPEANYSMVTAEDERRLFAAAYSKNVLTLCKAYETVTLVNGTGQTRMLVDQTDAPTACRYEILNCMGETVRVGTLSAEQTVCAFNVPCSGVLKLFY